MPLARVHDLDKGEQTSSSAIVERPRCRVV